MIPSTYTHSLHRSSSRGVSSLQVMLWTLIFALHCRQCALSLAGVASLTYYHSYPECCPDEINYDPSANTTECDLYNGCQWTGMFAALEGKQSYEFVSNSSLIAFYEYGQDTQHFHSAYGGKNITLVKAGVVVFEALIADTCADSDCNECCSANSAETGFLVDLEYFTMMRNFEDPSDASGLIEFYIAEVPSSGSEEAKGYIVLIMIRVTIAVALFMVCVAVAGSCYQWKLYTYLSNVTFSSEDHNIRRSEKEFQALSIQHVPAPQCAATPAVEGGRERERGRERKGGGEQNNLSTTPSLQNKEGDSDRTNIEDKDSRDKDKTRNVRPLAPPPACSSTSSRTRRCFQM